MYVILINYLMIIYIIALFQVTNRRTISTPTPPTASILFRWDKCMRQRKVVRRIKMHFIIMHRRQCTCAHLSPDPVQPTNFNLKHKMRPTRKIFSIPGPGKFPGRSDGALTISPRFYIRPVSKCSNERVSGMSVGKSAPPPENSLQKLKSPTRELRICPRYVEVSLFIHRASRLSNLELMR